MISIAEVDGYVQNGYHVTQNLVAPDEITELREDSIKLARGEYNCASLPSVDSGVSDDQALRKIFCIHQPHNVSPVMLKYINPTKICHGRMVV